MEPRVPVRNNHWLCRAAQVKVAWGARVCGRSFHSSPPHGGCRDECVTARQHLRHNKGTTMSASRGLIRSIAAAQQRGNRGAELWGVDWVAKSGRSTRSRRAVRGAAGKVPASRASRCRPGKWRRPARTMATCSFSCSTDMPGSGRSARARRAEIGADGRVRHSRPAAFVPANCRGRARRQPRRRSVGDRQRWPDLDALPAHAGGAWSSWEGPGFKGQPSRWARAAAGQNNGRSPALRARRQRRRVDDRANVARRRLGRLERSQYRGAADALRADRGGPTARQPRRRAVGDRSQRTGLDPLSNDAGRCVEQLGRRRIQRPERRAARHRGGGPEQR